MAANVNDLARTRSNPGAGWWADLVRAHRAKSLYGSESILHSRHRVLLHSHRDHAVVAVMRRAEVLSRVLIIAGVLLAIGVPLVLWQRTPLMHVSMAEEGGWTPDNLKAEVAKPLELHLISDDVMHGFAV